MSKLYLVRHAEPEMTGVILGQCDPPLSNTGKRDAALVDLPDVAVIYSSQLRRAYETALAVAGVPVIVDSNLNEISYGDWDGLSWPQIIERYPDIASAKLADWKSVTPPGGEEWSAFEGRVSQALERICAGVLPAAVVAHVTVNAQIAYILTGNDPSQFNQQYCEVLTYEL